MTPTFEAQRDAWARIPVDDIGYMTAAEILALPGLEELVADAAENRYTGWRNPENRWVELLGLDQSGRSVLDFGCGLGLDAAVMAQAGNCVVVADINGDSIALAQRVIAIAGREDCGGALIRGEYPYVDPGVPVDTFYASGVLHHIPYAADVVRRAAELVGKGGHIRAMVYGRAAYELHGPNFVRAMDAVGAYADWYDADKVRQDWGEWAELDYCEPITTDHSYLAVHLVAR